MKKIGYLILIGIILLSGCSNQSRKAQTQVHEGTSKPANIQFTLPQEWTVWENAPEDSKGGEETGLLAENTLTGSSIRIQYEDLTAIKGGTLIRMEDYVRLYREKLMTSKEYTYSCTEAEEAELYQEVYYCFTAQVEETKARQHFYLRRIDDMIMVMTITLYGEDTLENMLEYGKSL
ncbi:MAG: hypothetical protein SOX11_02700 [Lachnospiraceae bacterium]|nr:hypothetical protein [Lachnospiraceae bacterium]MDY3222035.1 hypothetical protein [Lachnospiraceae bacterium]